jgi:hypothetical protein
MSLPLLAVLLEQSCMVRESEPKDAEEIGQVRVAAWRAAYHRFMPESFLGALDPTNNLSELKKRLSNQGSNFTLFVGNSHIKHNQARHSDAFVSASLRQSHRFAQR